MKPYTSKMSQEEFYERVGRIAKKWPVGSVLVPASMACCTISISETAKVTIK